MNLIVSYRKLASSAARKATRCNGANGAPGAKPIWCRWARITARPASGSTITGSYSYRVMRAALGGWTNLALRSERCRRARTNCR